jgi:hypothetical protein
MGGLSTAPDMSAAPAHMRASWCCLPTPGCLVRGSFCAGVCSPSTSIPISCYNGHICMAQGGLLNLRVQAYCPSRQRLSEGRLSRRLRIALRQQMRNITLLNPFSCHVLGLKPHWLLGLGGSVSIFPVHVCGPCAGLVLRYQRIDRGMSNCSHRRRTHTVTLVSWQEVYVAVKAMLQARLISAIPLLHGVDAHDAHDTSCMPLHAAYLLLEVTWRRLASAWLVRPSAAWGIAASGKPWAVRVLTTAVCDP